MYGTDAATAVLAAFSTLLLTLGVGISLALLAYSLVWSLETRRLQAGSPALPKTILSPCARPWRAILNHSMRLPRSMRPQTTDRQAYRTFVTPQLARRPAISSLEWIPRVSQAQRERMRKRPGRTSLPILTLWVFSLLNASSRVSWSGPASVQSIIQCTIKSRSWKVALPSALISGVISASGSPAPGARHGPHVSHRPRYSRGRDAGRAL